MFKTAAVAPEEMIVVGALSAVPLMVGEAVKIAFPKKRAARPAPRRPA